jgi:hypothetical protein
MLTRPQLGVRRGLVVLAALSLGLAAGGIAYASIPDAGGVIRA